MDIQAWVPLSEIVIFGIEEGSGSRISSEFPGDSSMQPGVMSYSLPVSVVNAQ